MVKLEIDFRRDVPRLEVPVYVLDGLAELHGRRDLMLEWFADFEAQIKLRVENAEAAHSVAFEQGARRCPMVPPTRHGHTPRIATVSVAQLSGGGQPRGRFAVR